MDLEGRFRGAQRRVGGQVGAQHGAVGVDDDRWGMAGQAERTGPGGGIEDGVQAGGVKVVTEVADQIVEVAEQFVGRQVEVGEGAYGGAQATHGGRFGDAVSHDVADHHGDPVTGQRDQVVPVAAHLLAPARGQVARGGAGDGESGKLPGKQAALQFLCAGVFHVVQPGPFQRLTDQTAQRRQQGALLVAEDTLPGERHHA